MTRRYFFKDLKFSCAIPALISLATTLFVFFLIYGLDAFIVMTYIPNIILATMYLFAMNKRHNKMHRILSIFILYFFSGIMGYVFISVYSGLLLFAIISMIMVSILFAMSLGDYPKDLKWK